MQSVLGLNPVILHNALGLAPMCKRVVPFWDSSSGFCWHFHSWSCSQPLSGVCVPWGSTLSGWEGQIQYYWPQCDFSYQGKNLIPVYTRPVLSLPFLWSWELVVPCTWQYFVADSHGIQAGRVSKPEGDPGERSLGCASVLSRCPTARSADTLWEAQACISAWPAQQRSQQQPERICRQNLQAGPRYHSLPQCGASWQGSWCSLHPGFQLAGFSLGLLFNCKSSTSSNID